MANTEITREVLCFECLALFGPLLFKRLLTLIPAFGLTDKPQEGSYSVTDPQTDISLVMETDCFDLRVVICLKGKEPVFVEVKWPERSTDLDVYSREILKPAIEKLVEKLPI